MNGKIINWEFKEMDCAWMYGIKHQVWLKMNTIFETTEGIYEAPVFPAPENTKMMDLIDKELRLNLKIQHGILN